MWGAKMKPKGGTVSGIEQLEDGNHRLRKAHMKNQMLSAAVHADTWKFVINQRPVQRVVGNESVHQLKEISHKRNNNDPLSYMSREQLLFFKRNDVFSVSSRPKTAPTPTMATLDFGKMSIAGPATAKKEAEKKTIAKKNERHHRKNNLELRIEQYDRERKQANVRKRVRRSVVAGRFAEFVNTTKVKISDVFKRFDQDGSGSLTPKEFQLGLKSIGLHFTEDEIALTFSKVNNDGDEEITADELKAYINESNMNKRKADDAKIKTCIPVLNHGFWSEWHKLGEKEEGEDYMRRSQDLLKAKSGVFLNTAINTL